MPTVSLKNVNKIYDNNVQAVFDFNLDINDGEFIVLVGPSGCGKSTTLRMIAGLEEISSGELNIDGVISNDLAPKDRDIAMVFQNYALYPHMSVYDNMAFGLKNRKIPKDEIDRRVKEAAEILDITEYLDRKPKALSGGQCQRVALGRAIVRQAKTFLMDEPLSNLDAKLRVQMRAEIVKLHKRIKTITIYVTHDQTEAMTMADRIVVMSKGYIQQIGSPKEIYNHPVNMFVAGFIGSPSMNFIPATYSKKGLTVGEHKIDITKEQENNFAEFFKNAEVKANKMLERFDSNFIERKEALQQIEILKNSETKDDAKLNKLNEYVAYLEDFSQERKELVEKVNYFKELDIKNNEKLVVGIRPEDIKISLEKKANYIPVVAGVVELLGHEQIVHFTFNDMDVLAKVSSKVDIEMGQQIYVYFDASDIHLFDSISKDALF